jgi:hypothetical protein
MRIDLNRPCKGGLPNEDVLHAVTEEMIARNLDLSQDECRAALLKNWSDTLPTLKKWLEYAEARTTRMTSRAAPVPGRQGA